MRFIANENFPVPSIRQLREAGLDIAAVIEDSPGAKDADVLRRASREGRIVLTFDRHYGELVFRYGVPCASGILHLRFTPVSPSEPAEYVLSLLKLHDLILDGKYTVSDGERIRQKALP